MPEQTPGVKTNPIDGNAEDLFLPRRPSDETLDPNLRVVSPDASWVGRSFFLSADSRGRANLSKQNEFNQHFTPASLAFTDPSIGRCFELNPLYQGSRLTDPRNPGIQHQGSITREVTYPEELDIGYTTAMQPKGRALGMGDHYAMTVHDLSQRIHMRFGVQEQNSTLQFFTGFYSSGMATLARQGRIHGGVLDQLLIRTGNLIGLAVLPVFLVPMVVMGVARAIRFKMGIPNSKFVYVKPTMPVYWLALQSFVNQMAVNLGLDNVVETKAAKRAGMDSLYEGAPWAKPDDKGVITGISAVSYFVPDGMLDEHGRVDVRQIACRAAALEIKYRKTMEEAFKNADPTKQSYSQVIMAGVNNFTKSTQSFADKGRGLAEVLNTYFSFSEYSIKDTSKSPSQSMDPTAPGTDQDQQAQTPAPGATDDSEFNPQSKYFDKKAGKIDRDAEGFKGYLSKAFNMFNSLQNDGAEWLTLRVDYTGPVSESFSNSKNSSSLAAKLNDKSRAMRDIRFNLSQGDIIPGMGAVVDAVGKIAGGAAEVVHIDGLLMLAGNAFVNIGDYWDGSQANLPSATYTMKLRPPYVNPVTQLMDIWLPVGAILCGAIPLSTGAQSYTSPFLCQLMDPGRHVIRHGMISSVTISRGQGNIGFNKNYAALGVDVTWTVVDMSGIISASITPGFNAFAPLEGLMEDDNPFTDLQMAMAGMSLNDLAGYPLTALKYQWAKKKADFNSAFNATSLAYTLHGLPGMETLSGLWKGMEFRK